MSVYGFCPICGRPGIMRARDVVGTTSCRAGHSWPARESLQRPPSTALDEPVNTPDMYEDVRTFNREVVGPEVDRTWLGLNVPPHGELTLGVRLLVEEVIETVAACGYGFQTRGGDEPDLYRISDEVDHEEALDGAMDILFVLFGLLLRLGFTREQVYRAWREVDRCNMDKGRGPLREDGKRLKPADWIGPPDLRPILDLNPPVNGADRGGDA